MVCGGKLSSTTLPLPACKFPSRSPSAIPVANVFAVPTAAPDFASSSGAVKLLRAALHTYSVSHLCLAARIPQN